MYMWRIPVVVPQTILRVDFKLDKVKKQENQCLCAVPKGTKAGVGDHSCTNSMLTHIVHCPCVASDFSAQELLTKEE